jgi:tetratricopeptide (TPR) repeat protein
METTNPLGLNLDFMFGRGYLWANRERLSDWITLESLRMEIPDLSFPFDARGGLERFRNTRCLVREIEFGISEVGLGDLLRQAADQLDRFKDLQVRFLDDAVHISVRVQAFGSDTYVSFRASLIPPEPARADEIHLSLYDYRAYGPLPFPARLVAFELMTGLLNTKLLRPPGRGQSFTVGVAGDILSFRPLKLLLLHIFPRVGWKLPNLSGVQLDGARVRPGVLTIRASTRDDDWHHSRSATDQPASYQIGGTREGARALAAYEAKDLFANADQALFDGQIRQAMDLLAGYRDIYGLHTELVARALDCLLADPSPGNVAEAESMCRELEREEPGELRALLARPTIALVSPNRSSPNRSSASGPSDAESGEADLVVEQFDRLSQALRDRGETADWILAQLAAAQHLSDRQPAEAATRLREVLKASPRNRIALEQLRDLYRRLGEQAGLEEVLKRLTGVYTDRQTLKNTYLHLARHLMDREGELAEARLYLEKVLRLDPTQLEALNTLGESYVLSDEPLRALKAFGSAARAAEANEQSRQASRLLYRVARLWHDELGDIGQALLSCRRALSMWEMDDDPQALLEHADVLEFAAHMCQERERLEEATDYWMETIPLLEKLAERAHPGTPGSQFDTAVDSSDELHDRLVRAHEALAALYDRRERPEAAASHLRRIIELDPEHISAPDELERFYRRAGRPEQLIELYQDLVSRITSPDRKAVIHQKMADLYEMLHLVDDATDQLELAIDIDPSADAPRRKLVALLRSEGRFEKLRATIDRLLSRARDPDTRWELSLALGDVLFEELDQYQNAAKAYFEAIQIRSTDLDAMRRLAASLEKIIDRDGLDVAAPAGSGSVDRLLERVLVKLSELEPKPVDQATTFERMAALADTTGDDAGASEARRRADEAYERASLDEAMDVDLRLDDLLDDDLLDDAEAQDEITEVIDDQEKTDDDKLEGFREKYHALLTNRQKAKADSKTSTTKPSTPAKPRAPVDLRKQTEEARGADDPNALCAAIAALVEAHQDEASPVELDRGEYMRLSLELGELHYFDLEDSESALPHLERVRDTDPDGLGNKSTLLTTLEAIYEESGEVESRIQILRARLESADTEEMATTYRLLLAQLVWDEREDAKAARDWLDPVLDRDPRQESAHRLLAQIARDEQDFDTAATHLRTVLKVAGSGLDAVEIERDLAKMLLDQLDRPDDARQHFEQVLDAAPGDAMALDGIKQCQASMDDWEGYVHSLGHELGLLIGQPEGLELNDIIELTPEDISPAVRVPASQIVADAAHIVEQDLEDEPSARALWGMAFSLWPEHVEALERRIALDRSLDKLHDLADDLESYAELLLDTHARFGALVEAAGLYAGELNAPDLARPLFAEAIAVVQDEDAPPEQLDAARRALSALQAD